MSTRVYWPTQESRQTGQSMFYRQRLADNKFNGHKPIIITLESIK